MVGLGLGLMLETGNAYFFFSKNVSILHLVRINCLPSRKCGQDENWKHLLLSLWTAICACIMPHPLCTSTIDYLGDKLWAKWHQQDCWWKEIYFNKYLQPLATMHCQWQKWKKAATVQFPLHEQELRICQKQKHDTIFQPIAIYRQHLVKVVLAVRLMQISTLNCLWWSTLKGMDQGLKIYLKLELWVPCMISKADCNLTFA